MSVCIFFVCVYVPAFPLTLGWFICISFMFIFSTHSHSLFLKMYITSYVKFHLIKMFSASLILSLTFTKPLTLYLHLIYDTKSLLFHGLWSYIMLSHLVTERGQTRGTAQNQCWTSFFTWYIFLLNKVAARKVHEWFFHSLLTYLMLQYNSPRTVALEQHSHSFYMEIPLRSWPVNMLDTVMEITVLSQGQPYLFCVRVNENVLVFSWIDSAGFS